MTNREAVARIEAAALWAWPPRETAAVEGWLLRAAEGHTRRANSVRTGAFDARADLDRAVGRVETWYATRGLPACFQVTPLSAPAGIDGRLADKGYACRSPSLVLLLDPAGIEATTVPVELESRPTALVMNALCDRRWGLETRRARAALFNRIRRPHGFAVATAGGEPAAGGLCVVDGPIAGIFALHTQPPFRGRGYARAVMARLTAWARGRGATQVYLQVEEGNGPARSLFRSLGGETAYRYWYRERAAADQAA